VAVTRPTHLYFTGDDETDRFLAEEPLALLVGFVFDQQVTVQKAFSGNMARRVQDLCAAVAEDYGGRAERVWLDAESGEDLERRLLALPGIGPMKARSLLAILTKRFGVRPPGWEDVVPAHPTLGDVDSYEALEDYQEKKRAHKAALRAAKG